MLEAKQKLIEQLIIAIDDINLTLSEFLIKSNPELLLESYDNKSILQWAVQTGDSEIINLVTNENFYKSEELLEAIINKQDACGNTALHIALELGIDIRELSMLSHCTDIRIRNCNGDSPLDIAMSKNNVEGFQELIGSTPAHCFVDKYNEPTKTMNLLLKPENKNFLNIIIQDYNNKNGIFSYLCRTKPEITKILKNFIEIKCYEDYYKRCQENNLRCKNNDFNVLSNLNAIAKTQLQTNLTRYQIEINENKARNIPQVINNSLNKINNKDIIAYSNIEPLVQPSTSTDVNTNLTTSERAFIREKYLNEQREIQHKKRLIEDLEEEEDINYNSLLSSKPINSNKTINKKLKFNNNFSSLNTKKTTITIKKLNNVLTEIMSNVANKDTNKEETSIISCNEENKNLEFAS